MIKNNRRKIHLNIAVLGLISMALCAGYISIAEPDYSGRWTINLKESKFGNLNSTFATKVFTVKYQKDCMSIERVLKGSKADSSSIECLKFDGEISERVLDNTLPDKYIRYTKIKYLESGNLFIEAKHDIVNSKNDTTHYQFTEDWRLRKGNKQLNVIRIIKMPRSIDTLDLIYDLR